MSARRLVALFCTVCLLWAEGVLPAVAEPAPFDPGSNGQLYPSGLGGSSVVIRVGGSVKQVTGSDHLTAAEMLAVQQILSGGSQSLQVSSAGIATGGSFSVTSALNAGAQGLTIPTNITAVHDFAHGGDLSLAGALSNAGRFFAISTNPQVANASISALSIFNGPSALISSATAGMSQFPNAIAGLNLSLTALQDVVNRGTISSGGSLNISAGGRVDNGTGAVMQSLSNMSILSSIGNVTNAGVISSTNGNLNFATSLGTDMVLNNLNGKILAENGSITIGSSAFTGVAHTVVWGGDLLTRELNVFSGNGIARIDVNNLTGVVNIGAAEAHVSASAKVLTLGSICLTGDPTFFNKSGDVVINSSMIYAGAPLAIVASGNILTAPGAGLISTSSSTGSAGSILMVAGADFDTSAGSATLPPAPGDTTTTLTIYGATVGGGRIDLNTGSPIAGLSAASTAANGSGGNITLIAFSGMGVNSGTIAVPTGVTINASGNGSGSNGNITIIGGSPCSACAITAGSLMSSGGANGTGNITVATATPTLSAPVTVVNGAASGGTFSPGTVQTSSINIGNVTAQGGSIILTAGRSLSVGNILNNPTDGNGGSVSLTSNSTTPFNLGGGGANGSGTITAQGGLTTGNGGSVTVIANGAGGLDVNPAMLNVTPRATNGNGGTIKLTSGRVLVSAALEANGNGTGAGGTIEITANSATPFNVGAATTNGVLGGVSSQGATGGTIKLINNGGNLILASNLNATGSSGSGGAITLTSSAAIMGSGGIVNAGGGGAGNGGTITLSSQSLGGASNIFLSADAGATGNGGIVKVTTTSATGDMTVGTGAGQVRVSANGGTTSGDAGSFIATAGRNLTVNTAGLAVAPIGTDGAGAKYEFIAGGSATTANLFVNGNVIANGVGAGNGGSIKLRAKGAGQFNLDAGATTNGANGLLQANAGATSGNGGTINIGNGGSNAGTRINPARMSLAASPGGGHGGIIDLFGGLEYSSTVAPLTILAGTLDASAAGTGAFNGGTIRLTGNQLNISGGTLTVNANGASEGNGGALTVLSTTQTGDILVGNAAGQMIVNLTGGSAGSNSGNGGQVTLSAYNDILIDPAFLNIGPLGNNGNGGRFSAQAGINFYNPWPTWVTWPGRVLISGNLDVSGVGVGNGGTVNIDTNSASALTLNVGEATNGVSGGVFANAGALGGNGGSISLGNRRLQSFGTTVALGSTSNVSASASPGGGNGGSISIGSSLQSQVVIPAGTINVDGAGPNGKGGSITIRFWDISGISGAPLILSANGSGTGDGGSILLNQIGASTITIGNDPGEISLSATGGSPGSITGHGGSITVNAGNALSVDFNYLNQRPLGTNGNGGTLSLGAYGGCNCNPTPVYRSGNFFINQSLSVNGVGNGNGGNLYIRTNSPTAFTVGPGATTNGINGTLSADGGPLGGSGGTVSVSNGQFNNLNSHGGITILDPSALSVAPSAGGGHGGNLTINASEGPVTLQNGTYSVDAVGPGDWDGGSFWIYGGSISIAGGGAVNWSANAVGNGDGGYIGLSGFSTLDIGAGSHTFTATGGSAGSTWGDGGDVYLEEIGTLTIDGNYVNLAPQGTNGYGGDFEVYNANVTLNGTLILNGKGEGDGGYLGLYSDGARNTVINGVVQANSGSQGEGGYIDLENWGTGNITVNGQIYADSTSGLYPGEMWLETDNGTFTLGTGAVLSTSSLAGNSEGGWIGFWGDRWQVTGGGTATIRVDGSGTGAGGGVYIETDNPTGDIVVGGVNGVTIQARGGSAGSSDGDAGYIELYASRHLIIDTAYMDVSARGTNGDGAFLDLYAGILVPGELQITGSLNADGVGDGVGGDINLGWNSTSGSFTVGSPFTASGVTGNISANSNGYKPGGTIDFFNSAAAPMNITLNGTISTSSRNNNSLGTINFGKAGQVVTMAGTGSIVGQLNATGTSVTVAAGGPSTIQVSNLTATAGGVSITADAPGSTIFLPTESSVISATGNIVVDTMAFTSNGSITTTTGNVAITADSINYSCCGTVNAGAGTVSLAPQTAVPITVGATADTDGFNISTTELSRTTAGTLVIGDPTIAGNITIVGNFDVSGPGPAGSFNLIFNNGGTYTGTGSTITLGNHTLDVNAAGGGTTGTLLGNNTSITITTSNTFTVDQAVTAGPGGTVSITANAGSGAGIIIGADIGGGTNTTIAADGDGSISRISGTVSGTNVTLTSGSGDIGTVAAPILVSADTLTATTTGEVSIVESDDVDVTSLSAGGNLTLRANGVVTTSGAVSAGGEITMSAADVNINNTVTAGGAVRLRPVGDLDIRLADDADGDGDDASFDVNASEMSLISASTLVVGHQSTGGGVQLNGDVDVSGAGAGAYDLELWNRDGIDTSTNAITLGNRTLLIHADLGTANVGVVNGGNAVTVRGQDVVVSGDVLVNAGADLNITTTTLSSFDGDVTLNANVGNGANTIIHADGAGTIQQTTGIISGDTVTLSSDSGNIGAPGAAIQTAAVSSLSANTGGTADVYLSQANSAALTSSSAGDEFFLSVAGDFAYTATSPIVADDVTIMTAAGSNGNISFGASLSPASSLTVIADGTGSITQSVGVLTSSVIALSSTDGEIGASGAPIDFVSSSIAANTGGAGSVYLATTGTASIAGSSAGDTFSVFGASIARNGGSISAPNVELTSTVGGIGSAAPGGAIQTVSSSLTLLAPAAASLYLANTGDVTVDFGNAWTTVNFSTTGDLLSSSTLTAVTAVITTGADIGAAGSSLNTAIGTLVLNTTGAVYIAELNALSVSGTVGGALELASGPLTIAANLTAASMQLDTTSIINNNILATAGALGDINVNSPSTLSITGTGSINAASLNLVAGAAATVSQSTILGTVNGSSVNDFSVTTTSPLSVSAIDSALGNIVLSATNGLSVLDGGSLVANRSVTLNTRGNLLIGITGGAGVTVSAGELLAGQGTVYAIMNANTVVSNGSVLFDNYQGGLGTGDLTIGDNVTVTSRGGAGGVGGNIGVHSMVDITVGGGGLFEAWGGDIWMSAGDDLAIGAGTQLVSIAKLDDGGAMRAIPGAGGQLISQHTGGRVGLYAGLPATNMAALLNSKVDTRTGLNNPVYPGGYDNVTNSMNITDGGLFEVWLAGSSSVKSTIANNNFTSQGGVIVIDPPDPNNTLSFSGMSVLAIAPLVTPAPPGPVTPPGPFINPNIPVIKPTTILPVDTLPITVTVNVPVVTQVQPVPRDTTRIDANLSAPLTTERSCTPSIVLQGGSNSDDSFVVAAGACQSFIIDEHNEDGAIAIGERGTAISQTKPHSLDMKGGKMVVVTGKQAVTVQTAQGPVTLPASSAVMVEQKTSGIVRIANLDGTDASINVSGREVVCARAGEEVVIADSSVDDEELIPIDGVDRIAVTATLSVERKKIVKNSFRPGQMVAKDPSLNCHAGCFSLPIRNRLDKLKRDTNVANEPTQPTAQLHDDSDHLRPIAFPSAAPTMVRGLQAEANEGFVAKHNGTSDLKVEGADVVSLHNGEVLMFTRKAVSVKSGKHVFQIKPGTIVSLVAKDGIVKLRNLSESSNSAVNAVLSGVHAVRVAVGQEMIVGPSYQAIQTALRTDSTARRRIKAYDQAVNHGVITSEVSLLSLLDHGTVLSTLLLSQNSDDKDLATRIMKMAVCLTVATGGHGAYSTGLTRGQ